MSVSRSVATLLLSLALLLGSVWLAPDASCQESAPNQFEMEYVGSAMWGLMNDIVRNGDYVYCAMANGLQILDISDPTNPTLANRLFLDRLALSLALVDERLYVGYDDGYLELFDIGDPAQPVSIVDVYAGCDPIHHYQTEIWDVVPQDSLVYVACVAGLNILDFSDASHPEVIGGFQTSEIWSVPYAVEVVDGIAYLAAGKLWIIDVSDPTNPTEIAQYSTHEYTFDLEVSGDLLYIADRSNYGPSVYSRLTVVNVANAESPETVGSYTIRGYINSVAMVDSVVYCATEYSGVVVFDISDSASPKPAGCFFPPLGEAWTVEISNNLAFVCNRAPTATTFGNAINVCEDDSPAISHPPDSSAREGDFVILDVSDLANPEMIGRFPFYSWAHKVTVHDDHAFVCSEVGGMAIVDISEPAAMHVVSFLDTPDGTDTKVAFKDSLVMIAARFEGLQVVNVADITQPRIIGSHPAGFWASGIAVQGDYVYLSDYPMGLMIYDLSDPTVPDLIASLSTPGAALGVVVKNQYAYVSDRSLGLEIIDISDPATPRLIGNYVNPTYLNRWVSTVAIQEDLLVLEGDGLVEILDITVPSVPRLLGQIITSYSNYDLSIFGDYLFLAHIYEGIEVIDITDPTTPTSVSIYDSPGIAHGVAADGDLVYLADSHSLIAMRLPEITGIDEPPTHGELLPDRFQVHQNYPNPFNPSTTIDYALPKSSQTTLIIYNIVGQEVATLVDGHQSAGHHTVTWDGRDSRGNTVASGVYFYRLTTDNVSRSKKMLLLK